MATAIATGTPVVIDLLGDLFDGLPGVVVEWETDIGPGRVTVEFEWGVVANALGLQGRHALPFPFVRFYNAEWIRRNESGHVWRSARSSFVGCYETTDGRWLAERQGRRWLLVNLTLHRHDPAREVTCDTLTEAKRTAASR